MTIKPMAKAAAGGLALLLISVTIAGCNSATRNFGGTQTIQLEPGQNLDNVTWKDSDLWILTRPMHTGESAETWTFKESSNMGIMEGTVIIQEALDAPILLDNRANESQ